jgi:hypothetical protein
MHFILSPYEETYHRVRKPMRGPCSFHHDKGQLENMHIMFWDFISFNHGGIMNHTSLPLGYYNLYLHVASTRTCTYTRTLVRFGDRLKRQVFRLVGH